MAGERLYKLITSKGGKASDYADIVYGTVLSTSPLKVQLENNMVLTEDFLIEGRHIGKFKVKGKAKVKTTKDHDLQGDEMTLEYEFDNSLKNNDQLTMIRGDGGQRYYIIERLGKDGFGF